MYGLLYSVSLEVTIDDIEIVRYLEDYRLSQFGVGIPLERSFWRSRDSSQPILIRDQLPIDGNLIIIFRPGNGSEKSKATVQAVTRERGSRMFRDTKGIGGAYDVWEFRTKMLIDELPASVRLSAVEYAQEIARHINASEALNSGKILGPTPTKAAPGQGQQTTPDAAQPVWIENDAPVKPERFKELVFSDAIDVNTTEGAEAYFSWGRAYQDKHGRQSLNLRRDAEVYTGVMYETLYARAGMKRRPRAKD